MSFFDQIKEKIIKSINPKNIILIDNSSLHTKHKSFDLNKSCKINIYCKLCSVAIGSNLTPRSKFSNGFTSKILPAGVVWNLLFKPENWIIA